MHNLIATNTEIYNELHKDGSGAMWGKKTRRIARESKPNWDCESAFYEKPLLKDFDGGTCF